MKNKLCLATATHNFQCVKMTRILFNLKPIIFKSWCLNTHFIPNICDLLG